MIAIVKYTQEAQNLCEPGQNQQLMEVLIQITFHAMFIFCPIIVCVTCVIILANKQIKTKKNLFFSLML